MFGKERFRDYLAYKLISLSQVTFKARLMDKLPFYKEAAFCKGVSCYISSTKEMKRSNQVFEPQTYRWIASFRPGDVFYDIGANIGMFSLTVAKIHDMKVKTYSFEPSFSTFASLVHNVIDNRFDDVVFPYSIILGKGQGLQYFNYASIASGAAVHALDKAVDQNGIDFDPEYSQQMISYSLDDLVTNYGFLYPTHIKIDVDGGERDVLEGMKSTLCSPHVKSVMVEITETGTSDENAKRIYEIFDEAGFKKVLQVVHESTRRTTVVSDFLFVKNWNFPQ